MVMMHIGSLSVAHHHIISINIILSKVILPVVSVFQPSSIAMDLLSLSENTTTLPSSGVPVSWSSIVPIFQIDVFANSHMIFMIVIGYRSAYNNTRRSSSYISSIWIMVGYELECYLCSMLFVLLLMLMMKRILLLQLLLFLLRLRCCCCCYIIKRSSSNI